MRKPEVILIAAIAQRNRVIGKNGELPWHISEDLKRFKRLTLGHPVLMGRKTFESIVARLGGPLPKRRNMVLTSLPEIPGQSVEVYPALQPAITAAADEAQIAIIGGESVYREALPLADRLELTIVQGDYDGDAFFPEYEHLIGQLFHRSASEAHSGFTFETFVRIEKP